MFDESPERRVSKQVCSMIKDIIQNHGIEVAIKAVNALLEKLHEGKDKDEKLRDVIMEEILECNPGLLEQTQFAIKNPNLVKQLA